VATQGSKIVELLDMRHKLHISNKTDLKVKLTWMQIWARVWTIEAAAWQLQELSEQTAQGNVGTALAGLWVL